jgi:stearoyl-CoA desaturase (delta-9 desaturase)
MRLRHGLADGGRWLSAAEREHLNAWINARPCLRAICQLRAQLAVLMDMQNADLATEILSQWICAAQASGIGALQRFARAMTEDMIASRRRFRRSSP